MEFAVKKGGLDFGVKAVKDTEKLCEDAAGGAPSRTPEAAVLHRFSDSFDSSTVVIRLI